MSGDTRSAASSRNSRSGASYRERLEQRPLLLEVEEESGERARPDVEALRVLVEEVERDGSAFQSVAVAAVQIIERALLYEREAAEAALSLGQQEKLTSMVQTAEEAAEVLRGTLSAQGAKVMHLCSKENPPQPTSTEDASGSPWWFALTDALEVLEEGTGRMSSLTTAQREGSPACRLSRCITELLRSHHDALLLEADEWIS